MTSEITKDNIHFFRAPESIPEIDSSEFSGETYQSDLFSLGLVLSFLLNNFNFEKYLNSKIEDHYQLHLEIQEIIHDFKGFPLEKEILTKLVDLNPENRYENVGELLDKIQELVNSLKYNFIRESRLPIHFKLERTAPFLRKIANDIDYSVEAILLEPNEFLQHELKNVSLFLTNNLEFPLWTKGNSGSYYKFKKAYKRSNLAQIQNFTPRREKSLELTNIEICNLKELVWISTTDAYPYSNWEKIFANALKQIKEKYDILAIEEVKRQRWLKTLNIISEAEEEIEKRYVFEYEIVDIHQLDEKKDSRFNTILINVINDVQKESFSELLNESQTNFVELVDTDNIFERFKVRRKWKLKKIFEEKQSYTIVEIEGNKKNEKPPNAGFLRFWDLKNTIYLLKRKRFIIQNLENNDHLLDAILQPASTHKYFKKYDKDDLVSFIYYTYPIFLIQGPPGTGKTWTAIELIKLTLENDPFSRILVSSKEHSALDDLLIKCISMMRDSNITPVPNLIRLISPEREILYSETAIPFEYFITQVSKTLIKAILKWVDDSKGLKSLVDEMKPILQMELDSPSKEWLELVKESSNLVFCTSTASDLKELEYSSMNYDLVIIEEAGKTYPSELFKPMQLGNKWVLIGDQNQLPPFRIEDINQILEDKLNDIEEENKIKVDFDSTKFLEFKKEVRSNLRIFQSMFNRFKEIKHSFKEEDNIKSCDTLLDQYRLPSKISEMISTIFYNQSFNQKIEDPKDFILYPLKFKDEQLIWINTSTDREYREKRDGVNLYNVKEAQLITKLLSKIDINDKYYPYNIAILSPYKEQVEVLKKYLPNKIPNLKGIELHRCCYTVDSFQGQEADLIIISLVRNNNYENSRGAWGFIPRKERLNVMLSRAKKAEIIVGSFDMCMLHKNDPFMEKFVKVAEFIRDQGVLINFKEVDS
ncbi:MAG: ATP-dependent RecD-like DNA helicase [Candidatus Anoxychlamydiales bacterium]|nr:ATP-dependent RecD-like DNA helicase [Candidatus Anoxychlamydiales bacterium]